VKLLDIRKLAIRQQVRVRFRLANGMECVVDEHGVSRVPGLKAPPDFNVEDEFSRADRFDVEPVAAKAKDRKAKTVSRHELEVLAAPAPAAAVHDHDE
jgi:hypothetical protein